MRELLIFALPKPQPVELGESKVHAIITIDENGQIIGDVTPNPDLKGKMLTPTMPNRGSQVVAIAGSDTVQYFNPDYERHYRATVELYESILEKSDAPEVRAMLAFTKSGIARHLDLSEVTISKNNKGNQADPNKLKLAFIFAPTGEYIHDCETIVNYWIDSRRFETIDGNQIKCSITGILGSPLSSASADVKFKNVNGKLFSCNTDDAVSFGSQKYSSTQLSTDTYKELVQRLNYLANNPDHCLSLGKLHLLIWTDGTDFKPLLDGINSRVEIKNQDPNQPPKKTRKKSTDIANVPLEITDSSIEGIKARLLSLWQGTHAIARLDVSTFYSMIVTSQKTRLELSPIQKAPLVKIIENLADYHARQLRFHKFSRPYWSFPDALYPKVSGDTKPYVDRDRRAIFDRAIYGKPLPRTLISKALSRLKVEGVPIASDKHQINDRTYTQLSFLSLEIPMTDITKLSPHQQQAYALGKLYDYACRRADKISLTPNHGVRKLWGQINRNPKRALYQLAKRFPIYVENPKDQAIFNSLYRAVMDATPEVPEKIDLDYGVAFMWGLSAKSPESTNKPNEKNTED